MAYVTGTAASITDLLTAIRNACTANGWTLSGNVLHKDTCYVSLDISGSTVRMIAGRGIDGSNALTGASDRGYCYLGVALVGKTVTPGFPFAVTYFIHIGTAPDEVYVVVNYAVTRYQMIAWGQSTMPGLVGSGNWYSGPDGGTAYFGVDSSGEYNDSVRGGSGVLFMRQYESAGEGVDASMDATTWECGDGGVNGPAVQDWWQVMARQPNLWNGESVLIPVRVYSSRASGFVSPVLECAHARHVHIKNLADQQIITLGSDRWKVYPWWSRGPTFATNGADDSWYAGHALRYDGP